MPTKDRKALKQYFRNITMLAGILVLCLGFFYSALAWTEPGQAPPNGNTPTPLNVGPSSQLKTGNLQLKNLDTDSSDNLSGNWFYIGPYDKNYNQAQTACQAQGARLAYYSEIVEAYKNGASVCAAGWVQEGFGVYLMQNGAGAGCGGAVGGVRNWGGDLINSYFGAYCARDSLKQYGSLGIGGSLYARGIFLGSGQTVGEMYFGLLANGSNADKLGICLAGVCKTAWSEVGGYWQDGGSGKIYYNGGNVGIGTATPGSLLEVKSTSGNGAVLTLNHPGTADYSQINLQENGMPKAFINHFGSIRSPAERQNNLEIGTNSTNAIQFRPNDTAAMTIINGGNVGIGTATPGSKLHVASGRTELGSVATNYVPDGNTWNYNLLLDALDTSSIGFHDAGLSVSSIRYNNTGFTIGANDGWGVKSVSFPGGVCLAGVCKTDWSQASGPWTVSSNNIYNSNTGNVGIGTTAPSAGLKLDVEGQVGAMNYCDQNGSNCYSAAESQTIYVGGDANTFYPVFFPRKNYYGASVAQFLLSRTSVHDNSSWKGSFHGEFKFGLYNWGNTQSFFDYNIRGNTGNNGFVANPRVQCTGNSLVLYLRGDSTYYFQNIRDVDNPTIYLGGTSASECGSNVSYPPLAAGSVSQIYGAKVNDNGGNYVIGGGNVSTNGSITAGGGLCLAGVCKTDWSQASGPWTVSGNNIYNSNTGNVGIGTAAPGAKLHISNGDNSMAYFGPNSSWGAYLYVGSGTNKAAAGTAQVISTNGNLHLDSGSGNDMYLNYYSSGRPIHAYGSVDITNSLSVAGGTVTGETTSGHYYFKGVGGNSGQANAYYGIYQESGPWVSPYPDLRIQYHTGIKYDAYYGYGGHRFYTGYDGSGNPYGLTFSVGDGDQNVRVVNNLYVGAGGSFGQPITVGTPTANTGPQAVNVDYLNTRLSGGAGGGTIIADNSKACSADGTCETNAISATGNLMMGSGTRVAFNGSPITSGHAYGIGNGAAYSNLNSIAVDTLETDAGTGGGGTLELNYYGGNEVHIGPSGSKPLRAAIFYDGYSGYYADPAGTSVLSNLTVTGSGSFGGVAISAAAINGWNTASTRVTNFGGNWDSAFSSWGTHTVTCSSGQAVTQINGAGGTSVCGAAGLSQNDIETRTFNNFHVNKLYVTTIDPVYEIDGEKYATYVSDFAGGVRIETSGVLQLQTTNYKLPTATIDFSQLEKGSDLWLFWQTSNKNIKDLVVILTPGFDGKTWYEKQDNKIVIHGDKNGEVSYRLSLPRKDADEWPNKISK